MKCSSQKRSRVIGNKVWPNYSTKAWRTVLELKVAEPNLITSCNFALIVGEGWWPTVTIFQQLAIYNEFYRWVDTDSQISVGLPVSPNRILLATSNRKRKDFTEMTGELLTHCDRT